MDSQNKSSYLRAWFVPSLIPSKTHAGVKISFTPQQLCEKRCICYPLIFGETGKDAAHFQVQSQKLVPGESKANALLLPPIRQSTRADSDSHIKEEWEVAPMSSVWSFNRGRARILYLKAEGKLFPTGGSKISTKEKNIKFEDSLSWVQILILCWFNFSVTRFSYMGNIYIYISRLEHEYKRGWLA